MSQFEYPRPQLVRDNWINLNGKWRFRFDDDLVCKMPDGVNGWNHEINVPFAPETEMSGIENTGFHRFCWYERDFELMPSDRRVILHFGAVDYFCRVWVNGQLVLDQGYWNESFMTAPSDEHLKRDVELAKLMGFNGVRKHQKIEDPRYLYWADKLGLLVWEEMPSAYRFSPRAITRMVKEWTEAIERDYSHPCIIVWVPFNESWGVPNLTLTQAHRNAVEALYHLTRTLDATRPVIGNDGWEASATDILGIHDYDCNPDKVKARYEVSDPVRTLFDQRRPGGRILTLDGFPHRGQPIVLTEFGGIAYDPNATPEDGTWGYTRAHTAERNKKKAK